MSVSHLDVLYRRLLITKLFSKGWGDADQITQLLDLRKELCAKSEEAKLALESPIHFTKKQKGNDCIVYEGNFLSPAKILRPKLVIDEIKQAYFQMILPKSWTKNENGGQKPICIHLAGTGDHYFWRRRNLMVKPLLKHNIGSIILENPYYGLRKPKNQIFSGLNYVSDVFIMGACLILECAVLLQLCERQGFGPLGVTGLSMGGHMASLVATYWPKPVILVPCLSWSTASAVFTEGVMSNAVQWDVLQRQYFSNEKYHKILAKVCHMVDDPSRSGLVRLPNFIENISEFQNKCNGQKMTPYEVLESMNKPSDNFVQYTGSYRNRFNGTMRRLKYRMFNENLAIKLRDKHAIWFMRGLMDEFTHLKNYPVPVDTSLIIAICAQKDGYVPREGCMNLEELWPGCSLRYINCGHIQAFFRYLDVFRKSIVEAFAKKGKGKDAQQSVKVFS